MEKLYYIYLETSAVNYLLDNFTADELAVIKRLLKEQKNACFCISSTTISEILYTSEELRREKLIFSLQNMCHEYLINTPEELIIKYIESGMPEVEKKYDFYSSQTLANVWKDLYNNQAKTFIYDFQEFNERKKASEKIFKEMIQDLSAENSYLRASIDDAIKMDPEYETFNEEQLKIKQMCWLLIFLILCCGISIDNSCIEDYWNKLRISSMPERVLYSMYNLQDLTNIGPIVIMAIMWSNQLENSNRGTLMDMFHSVYIVYCDSFLSNDNHFRELKLYCEHVNFKKINIISENTFFTGLRNAFDSYVPS